MHALQNTIDWCINSATDLCGYLLEHRFTKFSDITQCNGHYAVQRHSMSLILVPIESLNLPSYTVSKLRLIIGEIFANERGVLHFNAFGGGDSLPWQYRHKRYSATTRFFGLHFRCRKYCGGIFNHFYVICPKFTEFGEITRWLGLLRCSRSSKVT